MFYYVGFILCVFSEDMKSDVRLCLTVTQSKIRHYFLSKVIWLFLASFSCLRCMQHVCTFLMWAAPCWVPEVSCAENVKPNRCSLCLSAYVQTARALMICACLLGLPATLLILMSMACVRLQNDTSAVKKRRARVGGVLVIFMGEEAARAHTHTHTVVFISVWL